MESLDPTPNPVDNGSQPTNASVPSTTFPPSSSQRSQNKRRFPPKTQPKSGPPSKLPRFNQPSAGRRGGASYQKIKPTSSLLMVPRQPVFQVYTSNFGVFDLCQITYQCLQARDHRMAAAFSELQFRYVTCLAMFYRMVKCAVTFGYSIQSTSVLRDAVSRVKLPDVIAKYIESVGKIETVTGSSIVPMVDNYAWFTAHPELYILPGNILAEAGRPIPPGDWAIDPQWIIAYNAGTSRASARGMEFRTVVDSDFAGRKEMLVTYHPTVEEGDDYVPMAPEALTEAEGRLGASYRFRQDIQGVWPDANVALINPTFQTTAFNHLIFFNDIVNGSFAGTD